MEVLIFQLWMLRANGGIMRHPRKEKNQRGIEGKNSGECGNLLIVYVHRCVD